MNGNMEAIYVAATFAFFVGTIVGSFAWAKLSTEKPKPYDLNRFEKAAIEEPSIEKSLAPMTINVGALRLSGDDVEVIRAKVAEMAKLQAQADKSSADFRLRAIQAHREAERQKREELDRAARDLAQGRPL